MRTDKKEHSPWGRMGSRLYGSLEPEHQCVVEPFEFIILDCMDSHAVLRKPLVQEAYLPLASDHRY